MPRFVNFDCIFTLIYWFWCRRYKNAEHVKPSGYKASCARCRAAIFFTVKVYTTKEKMSILFLKFPYK